MSGSIKVSFRLGSGSASILHLYYVLSHRYVVTKGMRTRTALSESAGYSLCCCIQIIFCKISRKPVVKSLFISEVSMLNKFLIQLFASAVAGKYLWTSSPSETMCAWGCSWLLNRLLGFPQSFTFTALSFSTRCLVVKCCLRCYGFMGSLLRTSPHTIHCGLGSPS